VDVKQAQHAARSFLMGSIRCLEQRPLPDGQFEMLVAPAAVCAALSAEIGLKAIILKEGRTARGHVISDLFGSVSNISQDAIVKEVGLPRKQFERLLAVHSEAFVEWRYAYESDKLYVDFSFLTALASAIGAVADRLG